MFADTSAALVAHERLSSLPSRRHVLEDDAPEMQACRTCGHDRPEDQFDGFLTCRSCRNRDRARKQRLFKVGVKS